MIIQVQGWLDDVFAGEQIPPYEINSQTISILHQVAVSAQKKAYMAKIATEDMKQKCGEYLAEGK